MKLPPELHTITLASTSPRRRLLLESLGLPFQCRAPLFEESAAPAGTPEAFAEENAILKAEGRPEEGVVIGADTIVVLGDRVLGKPKNRAEGEFHLSQLSGKEHRVLTGLCLNSTLGKRVRVVESRVRFRNLSKDEIASYLEIEEPYDKAGAYAVQGVGALFIESITGSYTNVMGFPIEAFMEELSALTQVPIFAWLPKLKKI